MRLFSDASVEVFDPMLRRAFVLAEMGRATTSPNPMVGCVVVSGDEVVGEGFHAFAGGPHAEVVALSAAGGRARGGTAYVTLEPCNHFGRTPPCTAALLSAGIARVVIGMPDPNRDVSGGGARALSEAGVEVSFADDPSPFEELNEAWLKRLRTGVPWVRVKLALTVDAKTTIMSGHRSKITGVGGSTITMRLRSAATAVAVGAATVDVDDPQLTVRDESARAVERQPLHVVLSRIHVPDERRALIGAEPQHTLLITSDRAPEDALEGIVRNGVRVRRYAYADGIVGALRTLAGEGVDDVLVEAGPGLMSALWTADVVDELVVVQAGGMAGNAAPPLYLGSADSDGYDLEPRMRAAEAGVAGNDAVVVWRPLRNDNPDIRKE